MLNIISMPTIQQIKYFESVSNYHPIVKNKFNKSIFIKLISIFIVSRVLSVTGNQPISIMSFIVKKIKI